MKPVRGRLRHGISLNRSDLRRRSWIGNPIDNRCRTGRMPS
jgi:hypothetical protein